MSANPYESPETVQAPLPSQSNLPKLAFQVLAVVGILGLLVALLLPATRSGGREASRRMQCSNNLKQIGLALQNYHDEYKSLPPAYIADANGKPIHSWRVLILPYLEQTALYEKYKFDEPWNGPNNSKLHNEFVRIFACPSRTERHTEMNSSYVAVVGQGTAWPGDKAIGIADITDPMANTILVLEVAKGGFHWMEPRDLNIDQIPMAVNPKDVQGISSEHPNVVLALFADSHTAALTNGTPPETIRRLLTIADGEPIGEY